MRPRDWWKKGRSSKALQSGFGFAGALALASTLSLMPGMGREAAAYSNSFLSLFFGILAAVTFVQVLAKTDREDKRGGRISLTFSAAFSFALVAGKQLETVENLNITDAFIWLNTFLLTFFFRPYLQFAWQWLADRQGTEKGKDNGKDNGCFWKSRDFWRNLVLIFLCWLPVFLAFYPGAFVYDAQDEYVQVATRNFTTHHPLIHVLLLGGFVVGGNRFWGSYNLGIAGYTLLQMAVLAAVFAYTLVWIKRRWQSRWIQWGGLLFYGLFPVIPMYAVCSAKDGLFTAALLIVVLQMLTLFEEPEGFLAKKSCLFAGILAAAAMMLLRNNGFYAYLVWIPAAVLGIYCSSGYENKKEKKKICRKTSLLCITSIALFFLVSKGLAWGLDAAEGGRQEIMTVPIQQLVRTYKYSPDTYSEEEKELLFLLLPEDILDKYNPRLSDIVKSKFNNEEFNANKGKYLGLWIKIGLRKPLIYLNGWLMTSYGFWYPDAIINVYEGNTVHTFTYEDSSWFGFETEKPGTRESKLPWLQEQYRKLSLELYQQKIPGLSMTFSPGFLFWVYAFSMGFLLWQRRIRRLVPMSLILLVWLTVLLGPTYLVRYVLILWFALPLIVSQVKICYSEQGKIR